MNLFVEGEASLWKAVERPAKVQLSDREINEKYDSQEKRIVTESNREKLPNFVDSLKRPDYIQTRPFYQRRARWTIERQSQLIESFIINVPVPPLFLYERAYNSYEVMDGQQRISAIRSFYNNEFELKGLGLWPELNGRKYSSLPSKIRAGIDRRSVSYIVLLNESAEEGDEALFLKQLVFERLNTGGVKLEHQEVRNCLYEGEFNKLLLRLSRRQAFARAWGIPEPSPDEHDNPPLELIENRQYAEMEDAELVLRFFALRHADNFRRGMQGFLDLYMIRARNFSKEDVDGLEQIFDKTLDLADQIYGEKAFRPFDKSTNAWSKHAQKAFYDAVMVGLSQNLHKADYLVSEKARVIEGTERLFRDHEKGTFTGRGNTKADVVERIRLYSDMVQKI